MSEEESAAYFAVRPRGSQLGAWASRQSTAVAGRSDLEHAMQAVEQRFQDESSVPKPPYWHVYRPCCMHAA